uniref:Uncharacterized protein n=1 Tax=Arundo donax TaxID=35708 RepID=A0A0A9HMG0_ARUDO
MIHSANPAKCIYYSSIAHYIRFQSLLLHFCKYKHCFINHFTFTIRIYQYVEDMMIRCNTICYHQGE